MAATSLSLRATPRGQIDSAGTYRRYMHASHCVVLLWILLENAKVVLLSSGDINDATIPTMRI